MNEIRDRFIGDNIRMQRLAKGYSQDFMANKLKKTQNWFSKLESGSIGFNELIISEIAQILEIPIEALLLPPASNYFINCTKSGQFVTNIHNDLKEIKDLITKMILKE